MSDKQTITMTVACRSDFHALLSGVLVLLLMASLLSSNPFLLLTLTFVLLLAAWQFPASIFAHTPTETSKASLSKDGELHVACNDIKSSEGRLQGVQWCSRYLAILRYRSEMGVHRLVLISAQQSPESFRQLCVWLRHNNNKEGMDQS